MKGSDIMKIVIDEVLKKLRSQKGLTQEALAEKMGVSVQAVSKWENGLSCPDIGLLPGMAEFLGVTADYLLTGRVASAANVASAALDLPDDGVLRVVQAVGNRLLSADEAKEEIKLIFPEKCTEELPQKLNVEIRCECTIEGDIYGDLNAGGGVQCGNVEGTVNAGNGIVCGNVGGSANAGAGIVCGNVGENVSAGDGVNCVNVGENVSAGDSVNCTNIGENASAGDSIRCQTIGGDVVECRGNIECNEIKGNASCEGDINYYTERVVKD
ncbi:MAG: helix-turn-helix domain-containing protein [Oscillospiraceae bacterium]|nr:helix-turn-helix domain-containing protein [Oscillospiraceae bacterium]